MDIKSFFGLRGFIKGDVIPLTYILIIINVIVFGIQVVFQSSGIDLITQFGKTNYFIAKDSEYWRLFTAMFLHVNIVHLLVNQFSLYVIGVQVEKLVGRWKFLAIYFVSGLFGSLLGFAFSTNTFVPSVGASGAIFGLVGMLLYYALMLKKNGYKTGLLPNILLIIGINLAFGFSQAGIDNLAHIGGLLGGFAMTIVVGAPIIPAYSNPSSSYSNTNSVVYIDAAQKERSKKNRRLLAAIGVTSAAAILLVIGFVAV